MKANGKLSRLIGLIGVLSLALVFALTGCVKVVKTTGITISQSEVNIEAGKTAKLRASVEPADAFDTRVYWYSTDEDVATVDSRGKVTGVAEGTAVITAETSDGLFFAECTVTVFAKNAIWDGETPSEQPDGFVTPDEEDPEADPNLIVIEDARALAYFAAQVNAGVGYAGKTVRLARDLDLNNRDWTPMNFVAGKAPAVIDGQGHKILNLSVDGDKVDNQKCGFIGRNTANIEIKDLTFEKANLSNTGSFAGTVIGYQYGNVTLNNVKVVDSSVKGRTSTSSVKDIRLGGLIGYSALHDSAKLTLKDCSVTDSEFYGFHNVGGLVGTLFDCWGDANQAYSADTVASRSITGCTVSGCTFTIDGSSKNYVSAFAVDAVYKKTFEETTDAFVALGNTEADNTFVYTKNILTVAANTYEIRNKAGFEEFRDAVNAGTSYKGKTVLLGCDIDLENEEWTPIGKSGSSFQGTFDGQDHTISNLKIDKPGTSDVGLFGVTTTPGVIKNFTVENADVKGYLDVGAIAGQPYTAGYENITLKGLIKVEGFAYVGGMFGKNVYASVSGLTVNADEGSYVKADSGVYRTYVGGVIGFMGEGNVKVSDVVSNIDVYGSTCDVGGITGIAHYGNTFENITCTGNVTLSNASDAGDELEIGGIAGVWMNSSEGDVTFVNCGFTGTLSSYCSKTETFVTDFPYDGLVGNKYHRNSSDGKLTVE